MNDFKEGVKIIISSYISKMIKPLIKNKQSPDYERVPDCSILPIVLVLLIGLVPAGTHGQSTDTSAQSENISVELSHRELQQFGDFSIQDALARIPGIQVGSRGEINLRGAGYHRYNVTVDGQRMGSSGLGDRSVDLGSISIDLIRDLEVIKVLTPDMDADALAGTINLRTYRPVGNKRELSVRVGGGANPQNFQLTGPTGEVSVQYNEPLRQDLSLSVNGSYQQDYRSREGVTSAYDVANFGAGPVDVLERVSPFVETDGRDRIGGGLRLTYKPGDRETYYVRTLINRENRERIMHSESWIANGNWSAPDTTGGQGRYAYELKSNNIDIEQYMIHAGGSNQFDFFQLDYNIGWTQSRIENTGFHFPFWAQNVAHSIAMDNRERPVMQTIGPRPDPRDMQLQDLNFLSEIHVDTRLSGQMDISIPFNIGAIKLGGSVNSTGKDANDVGAFRDFRYTTVGSLHMNSFQTNRVRSTDIFGENYQIHRLLNNESAQDYMISSIPMLRGHPQTFHRRSDIWNHGLSEQIYGVYGMTTLKFGMVTLMTGLRAEFTEGVYDGRVVGFNRFDLYTQTVDTSSTVSYSNLFPNAQIKVTPGDATTLHLAYSRSIDRHDYNILAPFELVTAQDTSMFRGNPGLEPMTAGNYDLQLDQQLGASGTVSIGVYYKALKKIAVLKQQRTDVVQGEIPEMDFIFEENEDIDVVSARETKYQNSDKTGTLYGVELAIRQQLLFLPGFLRNLGISGNYTWSQSDLDLELLDEEANEVVVRTDIPLRHHRPHTVNATFDYTHHRFYTRLSYHRTAEALTGLQNSRRAAPSINPDEDVYLDQYSDGWSDLSFSAGFRISDNFLLWAHASNLLGSEQISYMRNREFYPVEMTRRSDRGLMMGIQYNL